MRIAVTARFLRYVLYVAAVAFALGVLIGALETLLHLDPLPYPRVAVLLAVLQSSVVYGLACVCMALVPSVLALLLWPRSLLSDPRAQRRAGMAVTALLAAGFFFVALGMWYYRDAPFTVSLGAQLEHTTLLLFALASLGGGALVGAGLWLLGILSPRFTTPGTLLALFATGAWLLALPRPVTEPPATGATASPARPRVALIGIDAASWNVLLPWVEQGHLPNLRRLMDEGAWGVLHARHPTRSPAIWTDIVTGKKRAKHGIADFVRDEHGGQVPSGSQHRRVKALWNMLSEQGRSVWIIDWMVSHPPETVRGVIVTNLMEHAGWAEGSDPSNVYPPELAPVIDRLAAPARSAPVHYPNTTLTDAEYAILERKYLSDVDVLERIALYGCRQPWDLFALYTHSTDAVLHHFWKFMEPDAFQNPVYGLTPANVARFHDTVAHQFERVDALLGKLLECFGRDTVVMVVSDHGQQGRTHVPAATDDLTSGHHHNDGIVVLAGPHIRRSALLTQRTVDTPVVEFAKMMHDRLLPFDLDRRLRTLGVLDYLDVVDVAPTVLHLLGLPVAADMDGRAMEQALDAAYRAQHPVRFVDTYEHGGGVAPARPSSPLSREREEELRALGYIQ